MRTFAGLLFATSLLAARAGAACPEATTPPLPPPLDPLSDRPYLTEPVVPCKDLGEDIVEPAPQPLRKAGFGGMGASAALLGMGGILWLGGALTNDPGSKRFELTTALVLGVAAGALFVAGATIVVFADAIAPTSRRPTGAKIGVAATF